jgi:uncharacterized BrkB/YihY/UPF0761 family membrane protein
MAIPKRQPARARTAILASGTAASGASNYHLGKKDSTTIACTTWTNLSFFGLSRACLYRRASVHGVYVGTFSKYDHKDRCFSAGRGSAGFIDCDPAPLRGRGHREQPAFSGSPSASPLFLPLVVWNWTMGTRSQGQVEADSEGQAWQSGSTDHAESASDIRPKRWKDILLRVYHRISEDRILSFAAAVTFYNLLAIFPAIAALVAIYGLFADPTTVGHQVDSLSGVLPSGAIEVVRTEADRVARQPAGTLHGAFLIGLAISLWSANAGTKAIFDALNVAYGEDEKRGFFKLNAMSLAFTLGTLGFALIALGAIVVLPFVLGRLGLVGAMHSFIAAGKWPMLLVLVVLMLALLYRFGPAATGPAGTGLHGVAFSRHCSGWADLDLVVQHRCAGRSDAKC